MRQTSFVLFSLFTFCLCLEPNNNCGFESNDTQFFNYITITVYRGQKAVVNLRADTINHEKEATEILIEEEDIPVLKSGSFSDLPKLRHLTLHRNGIEHLETHIFRNLSSLRSLNMNSNNIKEIPEDVFANLTVTKICLCCNSISKLNSFAFYNLSDLRHLDLSNNFIKFLPPQLFYLTTNLKILYLQYNKLENIENVSVRSRLDSSGFGEAFYNIDKQDYTELDLSFNNYSYIDDFMFTNINFMTKINLANNNIKYISENAFKDIRYVYTIDLESNNLQQLSNSHLKLFRLVENIYLSNNPWKASFICRYEKWCLQFEKENTMDMNCTSSLE